MNTPHGILPPRRGFALVTVLFIVVLLTILVIGMFLMGESRTRSSALRIASLDTRIASETALNLAQTQIRDATSRGINSNGLATETWASQPGAIRTYDDAGNPTAIYKLYSSDTMVITNDTFTGNSDVPTGWETQPDSFTDINEPVNRPNPDTGDDNWIYPIVSPESIGNVVGFDATGPQNPDTLWDDSTAMPVRWLYLSADGSISTDPLANDPVARVAFWTDDESCKINVNTASATDQNSYWDMPRAIARYDVRELAFKQPAQYEYNRYPGHPATVSLSAVFPDKNNQGNAWLETLINTTPRYSWGGSKNATVTIASGSRQPIPRTKPDRLYATMDEYLYRPDRSVQLGLTEDELEQTRFFLTASSRSSELNLFGQPRVTIWPVHEETGDNYRTPFDQLIAFCSTIGAPGDERQYIFQRKDALSQTNDWNITRNQELVEYLRRLTSRDIPGFGGNFRTKYDVTSGGVGGERDQILIEIFDYIRCANLNETYSGVPNNFEGFTTLLRDIDGSADVFDGLGTTFNQYTGAGYVLPINTPLGRGSGRVPVVSEVGLWFIQTEVHPAPEIDPPPPINTSPHVEPAFIIETNTPMQGYIPWLPFGFILDVRSVPGEPLPKINGVDIPTGITNNVVWGPSMGVGNSTTQGGGRMDGLGLHPWRIRSAITLC